MKIKDKTNYTCKIWFSLSLKFIKNNKAIYSLKKKLLFTQTALSVV